MSDIGLLQEMLDSSDGIESIFQEFVLTKEAENKNAVYCFFEGSDDYKYYGSRIKSFTEKEVIYYDCGGKDNVLTLYGMIKENTSSFYHGLLFFIDKDFDIENHDCEEIYITPCYSIENFYITDTAITDFLKGEVRVSKNGCTEDKIDFEKAFNYIIENRSEFINDITMLNVWYSLQKNKSKHLFRGSKPDLTKLKSIRRLQMPIEINQLPCLTPNYIEITEMEIQSEKSRLSRNALANFRGKYYEEFLFKIYNKITEDSNSPKAIFSKRRKINLTIGKDNLISLLSQYADTPQCLKTYLKNKLMMEETIKKIM